jgi:hypothetical protein
LLTLIGCSSTKPLEILITPIKQVNLNLPEVDAITLDKVEWYIINKDNAEAVFAELDKKGYDEVLFGLNDKGYEIISVNMAKILSLVRQQAAIIGAYKKYHDTQTEVIKKHKDETAKQREKNEEVKKDGERTLIERLRFW